MQSNLAVLSAGGLQEVDGRALRQQVMRSGEDAFLLPSKLAFPVVGIGASAGVFPAIERLLNSLPARTGMAFVVIMHLSPNHPSMADAIFEHATRMPVVMVAPRPGALSCWRRTARAR